MDAPRIRVFALGSAASHALNHMLHAGDIEAGFIAANADVQDLNRSKAPTRLQFGRALAKGLGSGGDPEIGRDAATADSAALAAALAGAQLVIVIAGLGGGTGSGAAPVVCRIAEAGGAATLVIVTQPLPFEGRRRRQTADEALVALEAAAPGRVLVVSVPIPDRDSGVTMPGMFALMDEALADAVRQAIAVAGTESGPVDLPPGPLAELRRTLDKLPNRG